jgi:hypothetical protein
MVEPASTKTRDDFLPKIIAMGSVPELSHLLGQHHRARLRSTPRSMLPIGRVRTRRPCAERPDWPPRIMFSWTYGERAVM